MDPQYIAGRIQNILDALAKKESELALADSGSLVAQIESEVAKIEQLDPSGGRAADGLPVSSGDRLLRLVAAHLRAADVHVRQTHLNEAQQRLILAQNLIVNGTEAQPV